MIHCNHKGNEIMATTLITVRIDDNVLEFINKVANQDDRSRNYVINKFLKEKTNELAGDCS